jgi:signal transduction histidine kinase
LVFIFFVIASAYVYGKQLRRKNQNLEKIIIERTKEIQKQKDELEVQKNEVAEKNKELYQLNLEKNKLIGMVAHDLKSPLGQIKGIASIIKSISKNLTDEQQDLIEKIFEVSSRLSKMISNILNVNAIETGRINLDLQEHHLTPIVKELTDTFKISADEKDIKLYFESEVSNDVCLIDRDFFILILENLISNAVKFCYVGKSVCVTLTNIEDKIRITVKDEGPGIKETEMDKLFQSYQKLSSRPTGGENSTGLGLSIVKRYVEAMNGQVWCESVEECGASFIVDFSTANSNVI